MADGGKPRKERISTSVKFTPRLWKRWHEDRPNENITAILSEGIDQMRKSLAAKDVSLDDIKGFYTRPDDFKRCKSCGALTGQLRKISLSEARKAGYDAGWRDRSYEIQGLTYAAANALPPYHSGKHRGEWEKGYMKGYKEAF